MVPIVHANSNFNLTENEILFLNQLNYSISTSDSIEEYFKKIRTNSLEELISIRTRSMILSHKNLDNLILNLLAETFNFNNLKLKRISWTDSTAQLVEFVGLQDRVRRTNNWKEVKIRLGSSSEELTGTGTEIGTGTSTGLRTGNENGTFIENGFRCYGLFHDKMKMPVSFVYIRLYQKLPQNVQNLLNESKNTHEPFNSCIFYSITSPFKGLNGIEFGGKLIKSVVEEVKNEFVGKIKLFATLSPIPNFRKWLLNPINGYNNLNNLSIEKVEEFRVDLMEACGKYLNKLDTIDPVARFHYRNGAVLGKINFAADSSISSFRQSYGLQVNYIYNDL